tara:strand:- start:111 stop:905 length:795 start_codon:yes stop_codon:yes gene_type:complete
MKKYLVVGNPINHSLSPLIHNLWIKENNIKSIYDSQKLNSQDLGKLILSIREGKISGANITVPFKREIITFLDKLSPEAKDTQSVNTIYLKDNEITGHNTDVTGFKKSIEDIKFNVTGKKILILGAGGVVPSIIYALNKMKASQIMISNRTKSNADNLKKLFKNLNILSWGELPDFDMIINATSLGLNEKDSINLDFSNIKKGKFFYDVIYNPEETNFLNNARKLGHETENGKKMFVYQAALAFEIWHGIQPRIDEKIFELLNK